MYIDKNCGSRLNFGLLWQRSVPCTSVPNALFISYSRISYSVYVNVYLISS